jgi:hypothetical protein
MPCTPERNGKEKEARVKKKKIEWGVRRRRWNGEKVGRRWGSEGWDDYMNVYVCVF